MSNWWAKIYAPMRSRDPQEIERLLSELERAKERIAYLEGQVELGRSRLESARNEVLQEAIEKLEALK